IPHGTALNNTLRQIAASVGTATLVTVMTLAARDPQEYGPAGQVHGVNVAFIVAGVIASAGVAGALFLRNSRPVGGPAGPDRPAGAPDLIRGARPTRTGPPRAVPRSP